MSKRILILFALFCFISCNRKTINATKFVVSNIPAIVNTVAVIDSAKGLIRLNKDRLKVRDMVKDTNEYELINIVNFELNSDIIIDSEKLILDECKPEIDKAKVIVLLGGCCPLGTDEYNYNLGLRRCKSVAKYLNIKPIIESVGETELICITSLYCYWKNRRCEIYIKREK